MVAVTKVIEAAKTRDWELAGRYSFAVLVCGCISAWKYWNPSRVEGKSPKDKRESL